jgi:hypothetical protein
VCGEWTSIDDRRHRLSSRLSAGSCCFFHFTASVHLGIRGREPAVIPSLRRQRLPARRGWLSMTAIREACCEPRSCPCRDSVPVASTSRSGERGAGWCHAVVADVPINVGGTAFEPRPPLPAAVATARNSSVRPNLAIRRNSAASIRRVAVETTIAPRAAPEKLARTELRSSNVTRTNGSCVGVVCLSRVRSVEARVGA